MGVDEIRLFDIDTAATAKLQRNLRNVPGLKLLACTSAADAVRGTDIVTTVTADKTRAAILSADMVEPGMHINAVGGDCPGKTELHPDVLRMARVVVEYEPQTRIEGDIQQLPADFAVTELWRVLQGHAVGREDARQITVFDSVGFALEDFSALRWLRDSALELGLGSPAHLVPALNDPKDLFALLNAPPSRRAASIETLADALQSV
jgi:ornithine cyclodeaminase